jgi:hypothetical protein
MNFLKAIYLSLTLLLGFFCTTAEAKILGEVSEHHNKRSIASPVRSGKVAYKHEVTNSGERDEYEFRKTDIGGTYWYGFSYYFTESITKSSGFTIINQIGAYPSNRANGSFPCGGIGSKMSVRDGSIMFDFQYSGGGNNRKCTRHKLASVEGLENKWTDFVMHAKWTGDEDGFLKIWMRAEGSPWEVKLDYKGRTFWNNEGNGPFFKLGIYLGNPGNGYRLMYTDEYRHGDATSSFEEVEPGRDRPIPIATIDLLQGWNLVSLPIQPFDYRIDKVLTDAAATIDSVYSFNGTAYQGYTPGDAANTLTRMESGIGYWLYSNTATKFSVAGTLPQSSLKLKAGWNLVGFNGQQSTPISAATASIQSAVEAIYSFDTTNNNYKSYFPGETSDLTALEPGRGYWVYVSGDTTWTL